MTLQQLHNYLAHPNVQAFLRVIRARESAQDDSAYFMRWPGKTFADLSAHPNILEPIPGSTLKSSAAGAYQITGTTWRGLVKQYGFPDFSRSSQDMACVALIAGRGALDDVLAGRLEAAIAKCRQEWTSLPGAAESRSSWTMDKARAVYLHYGGVLTESAPPPLRQRKDTTMPILALISAFGPLIAELIPQVSKLFTRGERGEQNLAAATAVFDTVVKASGRPNIQSAVEAMQADPALVQTVTQAVVTEPAIMAVLEIGGGIAKAREADAVATQAEKPFWYSQAFWMTLLLVPLVYIVVCAVVFNWGRDWSDEMRSVVVTAIVTGLLGSVTGYFLGSSLGSQRKDALLASTKG